MTQLDRNQRHPGYWPSPWPVECGGNRRQKAVAGSLGAASETPTINTRRNDRWNVMVINRDPDEWYLGGTMAAFSGPPPFGWVEKVDPVSLEPIARSPELPCGEHVWCGAILAHANGLIMSVNGSFLHSLDPEDLTVVEERRLPAERSHNGLLALSDGTLITKDLRLEGQGGTTITRLDPTTFELVGEPLVLLEGSMGRIAADTVDDREFVYVPGTEHIWRLVVEPDSLVIDEAWNPRYRRSQDDWGLAWDGCISDHGYWIMDCGDIPSVRMIHRTEPNGRFAEPPGQQLSWRQPAPWSGAQRIHRMPLDDAKPTSIEPFGTPGGGIIAPPVNVPEHEIAIAWDSINGGLAGISTGGDSLEVAWQLDARPSMQPVVYPDSGELAINDFTDDGHDEIIVVDIPTGEVIGRARTGSRIANGMFLTPDGDGGLFYCTTTTVAHVSWS